MNYEIGEKYLITTDEWFFAPDGSQYKAVWGTFKGVSKDEETLGIKTNRGSTNWYIEIGEMTIAGCQVFYVIKSDNVNLKDTVHEQEHELELRTNNTRSKIYYADKEED